MTKTFMQVAATTLLLGLGAASAQSLSAAESKLATGDWRGASQAATALNTSAGYALAAKATTAGASLGQGDTGTLYQRAQDYASKAIAMDKNNATAYFELARAQGRLAQSAGILKSLNLAGSMKKNLDTAIRLDPNLAGAYVALGLWNAELTSKGFAAKTATGAKTSDVVPNFNKAVALEPNNPTHRLEYGRALLLIGNKAEAKAQLQKAANLSGSDYWEKRDQQTAKALLAKL